MTKLIWSAIVRNEARIIERCVRSLLPHIDGAVVVDTGSTDGTQERIERLFRAADKPLELHAAAFENFSQARNVALACARASKLDWSYLLLADADMELVAEPGWCNGLTGLSYDMLQKAGPVVYWNRRLVSRAATGSYTGVTHEYLNVATAGKIESAHFVDHYDGSNRPDKLQRDIALLEQALETETNPGLIQRYNFYLAQSYFDKGNWVKAAEHYKIRAGLGGFDEEVWNAQMHYAHCLDNLGKPEEFVFEMLKAYELRPHRAEVLYDLAKWYRLRGENFTSLLFSDFEKPDPKQDQLFVNDFVYKTGLLEEFAICAYYDPARRDRGEVACNKISLSRTASMGSRHQARYNQYWYLRPLTSHVPSFTPKLLPLKPPDGYAFMNPSVINKDGKVVAIVRAVNYRISPEGQYVVRSTDRVFDSRSPVHSRNFLVHLEAFAPVSELLLPDNWPEHSYDLVRGLEDSRLFVADGELLSISTVRELNIDGTCEMVLAPVLEEGCYGCGWYKILPRVRLHEKNWQPCMWGDQLCFVYRQGTLIDLFGNVIVRHTPAPDLDHVSGGSQVIEAAGWMISVVHEARTIPGRSTRYYQHRFVRYSKGGAVEAVSLPFVFFDRQVEFAAGLAYFPFKRELMVSFGVRDEEAWFATMNVYEVLDFIDRS